MRRIVVILLPILALLLAPRCPGLRDAHAQGAGPSADPSVGKILLLHTYHHGFARTDGLTEGLSRALTGGGLDEQIMVEYLDYARLGQSPQYQNYLDAKRDELAVLVKAAPPSVVIAMDWTALRFWKKNREALAPGVPVVYCGIGSPPPVWAQGMENTVGVVETPAFAETLEAALRLVPKAKKLLVLESSARYFSVLKRQLDAALAPFAGRIEIDYHTDQNIESMENRLKTLGPEWIVLCVGRPEQNGVPLTSPEAAERVSRASRAPVFVAWHTWMGHGVVGGKVMFSQDQGAEAGKLALEILGGRDVAALHPLSYDSGRFVFDYAVLKRFKLDPERLPPDSEIVNKPVSFYESHRLMVWVYGLFVALLLAVTGGLLLLIFSKRRFRDSMRTHVNFVESLMEAMPTPVFYKDTRGVYLGCNRAFESFMGISRERMVGHTVHDLYPASEADVFKRQDDALFAAGPVQFYEFEKSTQSGPRQIRFHKALYHDAAGNVAGLVGVIADITDLRTAEGEREKARGYLQAIIDSSPSAILCVNEAGQVTHANLCARELLVGDEPYRLPQALPRMPDLMDSVRRAVAEGKTLTLPRVMSRVGEESMVEEAMIYPLYAMGLSEAVVRVDDVTGRHRMEEMLVQSEKMMSVGGLAAGMAHEINNPLGGIMQSAQVILTRMRPDLPANLEAARKAGCSMEAVRTYLESREFPELLDGLRQSAQRAAGIVSNMLEFSRRSSSAWLPVEVNSLADKALDLCLQDYNLAERFDFKKIVVTKRYDAANPSVPCSSQQIQQVVFNILRNAAQAMFEAGTPEPAITLVTRQEDDCVSIEVRDNGPGMDEATRRKVFEPFFTTKEPGLGTGLGLSVSYFIVRENHGGEIEVESEPGQGARFIIHLPIKGKRCV